MSTAPAPRPEAGARSGGLLRSGAIVAAFTLLSRVTGLARDVVMAVFLGISGATDAFFVAFKIPNLFRRLVAEGAFSQGFVPVLGALRRERPDEVPALIAHVAGTLVTALGALTALLVLAAPGLVLVFAPGFAQHPDRWTLATDMLRLTAPYVFFISLCALAAGVLNTWGRFAAAAFSPVILNLCLIGATVFGVSAWAPELGHPVQWLAAGVLLAGVLQFFLHAVALARLGLLPRPRFGFRHPGVRRVLGLMGPAALGASVAQVNLLVDTLLASLLVTGSISWLFYADRLVQLPLGVFGVGLATVILPRLSALDAAGGEAYGHTLAAGLRLTLLIALPAAAALVVLAHPVLGTIYGHGAMSALDVEMAVLALRALAVGLPGFMLAKVLAAAWFARQDTVTPMRLGLVALVVNLVLNLALIGVLGHVGLALGTAGASLVNAWLLARGLARIGLLRDGRAWAAFLLRAGAAVLAMTFVLAAVVPGPRAWGALGLPERLLALVALVGGGATVYSVALTATGLGPRRLAALLRTPAVP